MSARTLPDVARLRQLFSYNPRTGILTWCERPREDFKSNKSWRRFNNNTAGKTAGGIDGKGYLCVMIDGITYKVHRIVWKIRHGTEPPEMVDHINRDTLDNRVINLRAADRFINEHNRIGPRSDNKSGYRGVSYCNRFGKWKAQIAANHKERILGYFDTREEASDAYMTAKALLHPSAFTCDKQRSNNTSGYRGVSPARGKWRARIRSNKEVYHLGTFDSPEAASEAYENAMRLLISGIPIDSLVPQKPNKKKGKGAGIEQKQCFAKACGHSISGATAKR